MNIGYAELHIKLVHTHNLTIDSKTALINRRILCFVV